jgi:hypothetical protein
VSSDGSSSLLLSWPCWESCWACTCSTSAETGSWRRQYAGVHFWWCVELSSKRLSAVNRGGSLSSFSMGSAARCPPCSKLSARGTAMKCVYKTKKSDSRKLLQAI